MKVFVGLLAGISILLAGCGGGGGTNEPSANAAPVANAGAAQNVSTTSVVTIDGSASTDANGDVLTYAWTLTSKPVGSTAELTSATSAKPTFTADIAGTYVVSLVVNDGKVSSAPTTATISATNANAAPAKPTVNISISSPKVSVNQNVTVAWSTSNATSCVGVDNLNIQGNVTAGSINITPTIGGNYMYSVSCNGPGGTIKNSVGLIVPIPVQATSYLNAKNLNIPSQRYPAFNQLEHNGSFSDNLGAGVAFADFFQEGKISMVWFTNRGYYNQPTVPNQGIVKFYKFDDKGNPVEFTSDLISDVSGCVSPRKLLVADFNGDGKPDIFASCHGAELTPGTVWPGEHPRVLLSQPDGKYKNILTALNCYCHTAAAADLNGDGFVDILTSDQRLGMPGSDVENDITSMILLSNDGKGNFTVQRNYTGVNISMPSVVTYNPLVFSLGGGKTNTFTMEIVDVNGDGKPDLIFGTSNDIAFPSRIYINRNNRFDIVDALIPIGIQGFWAIDIVVKDSYIYFYGLKNYYDTINIYKYNFLTKTGSIIYDSNGKRWPNAIIDIDWVWMTPYNGNLVPLSDAYTGVSVPM